MIKRSKFIHSLQRQVTKKKKPRVIWNIFDVRSVFTHLVSHGIIPTLKPMRNNAQLSLLDPAGALLDYCSGFFRYATVQPGSIEQGMNQ